MKIIEDIKNKKESMCTSFKEKFNSFFGDEIPIEKKLYYTSCLLSVFTLVPNFITLYFVEVAVEEIIVNSVTFIFTVSFCIYGFRVKDYYKGSIFMCVLFNFIVFPILFFFTGGVQGGVISYFILGIFLSGILLKGFVRALIYRIAIIWYALIIKLSYTYSFLNLNVSEKLGFRIMITSFVMTALFITYIVKILLKNYVKNQKIISELRSNL